MHLASPCRCQFLLVLAKVGRFAALPLVRHDFHGDWNYTLNPN